MHQKNKILIIAGKMHGAGQKVFNTNGKKIISQSRMIFIPANLGADVMLLPAQQMELFTHSFMSEISYVSSLIDEAHKRFTYT